MDPKKLTARTNGHKRAYPIRDWGVCVLDTIYGLPHCTINICGSSSVYYFWLCAWHYLALHIRRVGVALLVLLTGFSGFNGYGRSFTTRFIAIINARIFHFWAVRSFVCAVLPSARLESEVIFDSNLNTISNLYLRVANTPKIHRFIIVCFTH